MAVSQIVEGSDSTDALPNKRNYPWVRLVLWGLMLAPTFLLLEILSLGAHVRLALGHWPKPVVENYNHPLFELHSLSVIFSGFVALFMALPLWLFAWCFRPFRTDALSPVQLVVFILGWGAVIAYCAGDPHRFVAWLID